MPREEGLDDETLEPLLTTDDRAFGVGEATGLLAFFALYDALVSCSGGAQFTSNMTIYAANSQRTACNLPTNEEY